ncbi:MAG: T9SS type A sorting domain-containing protein [Candidatus Cloacimonetes bacterium]|nr:T9SS type A sorting domain-containing protein [Candidatus Cloacimonadota bacterium]
MKFVLMMLLLISGSLFSQVPDFSFLIEPTELINSYYDYMPGGFNNIPIQIQPEISYPNNYPAGGVYIIYHAQETPFSERFVYYSYINSSGEIVITDKIGTEDFTQGYAGVDIDPVTCDPICCWHTEVEENMRNCHISADLFHNYGFGGNWSDEYTIIDNPEAGFNFTGYDDDEFIWPAVHISDSSPLGGNYNRIYISANNATPAHGESPYPCENVLLGYADYLPSEMDDLSALDWTFRSIEQMDAWSNGNPYKRPLKALTVHENIVIYAGYVVDIENSIYEVFVLINENYGEGAFEYYSQASVSLNGALYSKNMNVIFRDDYSKISFVGARYETSTQYYPRLISFDLNSHEFSFLDLSDESLPFTNYEDFFHYNNFKIAGTGNRLVAVWQDCLNAYFASQGQAGYEEWQDVFEIVICVSGDAGETWSEPVFLNPFETPEFADLLPNFAYPGDVIEDIGNDHGKLHLFFYNKYIYGQDPGGSLMYAALDIDFGSITFSENVELPETSIMLSNFPNPFSSSTTISFTTTNLHEDTRIEIYNIRGQRVKSLECINRVDAAVTRLLHSIIWDGKDDSNKSVNSGVYFYKIKSGKETISKKMILIR